MTYVHLLSSVLAAAALAAAGCAPASADERRPAPTVAATAGAPPPAVKTSWCGEGLRALDETTCLAEPGRLAQPPSLVIFAHGMLAPGALPAKEQATLLAAARKHGFAVLFPRGKPGLCTWEQDVASHTCWPTKQRSVDEVGPKITAEWANAQGKAEDLLGVRFEKRYLFGFSNGGYFVAFLTVEGNFAIDGAGVVGAGRTAIDDSLTGPARPPLYLAVGDQEANVTRQDAETLANVLRARNFPVTYKTHAGRGHELQEDDLAAAWAAWGR